MIVNLCTKLSADKIINCCHATSLIISLRGDDSMAVSQEETASTSQSKILLFLISPSPVLLDYSMQITLPNGYTFASASTQVAVHGVDDKSVLARSFNKCGSAQTPFFWAINIVLPPLKITQPGLLSCCTTQLDSQYAVVA